MANIANLAYEKCPDGSPNAEEILKQLRDLGNYGKKFKDVIPFDKNSSQAILVIHENYAVAAFRGTDELADWWDNINALPEAGHFGSVHQGFRGAMRDVWPAMRVNLRALRKERRPLPL